MLGKFKGVILEIIKYLLVMFALRHVLCVVRPCNWQTFEKFRLVWLLSKKHPKTQHPLLKSRSIGLSLWSFVDLQFMSKRRTGFFHIHEEGTKDRRYVSCPCSHTVCVTLCLFCSHSQQRRLSVKGLLSFFYRDAPWILQYCISPFSIMCKAYFLICHQNPNNNRKTKIKTTAFF